MANLLHDEWLSTEVKWFLQVGRHSMMLGFRLELNNFIHKFQKHSGNSIKHMKTADEKHQA